MAKTQKRSTSRAAVRPQAVVEAVSAAPRTSIPLKTSQADFNPDYTLVKQDLKRIAILAVTFISSLVVLSFFLR